ncbi:hypothetical protein CYLTODRAFT_89223 [Cylindrobasidium torrendii FP15055 ss-10]|uniref:Uncharacterized protein n=1 Tax=Cylindrobasidium torrendii FP15055 ss-10 TaxID=1314674 RepID=A0A0D7B295_9AGAR|nr:hypothetical protein CYLTODRAFT_89223 [Cylindrobasidium torrendii FP15055 ss-10]
MATPATPANAGHNRRGALDRNAKHGLKIYTDHHTTVPYFDAAHTPTTIHHPDHATVGLDELLGRLEAALGDRKYDPLTGENFSRDRVTEVNHIAHTNLISFVDFWRMSKAFGYNLHPHSTCNTLLSMSNNHLQFGKLHEALCLTQEDWEMFLHLVSENLQLIDDGKPAINLFNHPKNLQRITDQHLLRAQQFLPRSSVGLLLVPGLRPPSSLPGRVGDRAVHPRSSDFFHGPSLSVLRSTVIMFIYDFQSTSWLIRTLVYTAF